MALLKDWRDYAYSLDDKTPEGKQFWLNYFGVEQDIYKLLLADHKTVIKGTVKELAEKYETTVQLMTGFLDGINESLKTPNPIEEMEEDTEITIELDIEALYMNMVKYNAEWLYTLEEWDSLLTEEERKELYKKQKSSTTVVKPKKVGRNEPCPCGSGRKYKQCCGK